LIHNQYNQGNQATESNDTRKANNKTKKFSLFDRENMGNTCIIFHLYFPFAFLLQSIHNDMYVKTIVEVHVN
jgi:hypothetical protein